MSIALDTALYLREQKQENPLTLSERGILFTLLFRVGSNPYAWVSQRTLSIECDIIERNVIRLLNSIVKKGYIIKMVDPQDKRKNLYRPAEFLINYHQKNNRAQSKEYMSKLTPNFKNTCQNRQVNTCQNRHVLFDAQMPVTPVTSTLNEVAQIPKDTIERYSISKDAQMDAQNCANAQDRIDDFSINSSGDEREINFDFFWNLYPIKKDKKRAYSSWNRLTKDSKKKIIEDLPNRKEKDSSWLQGFIPHPTTYLNGELWEDEITPIREIKSHQAKRNPHEMKSTVRDWAPGNPDYDRVHYS